MVSCPGCGGEMRFDPATQNLKCDHCDTLLPVDQFIQKHEINSHMANGFQMEEPFGENTASQQSYSEDTFQTYVFTCPQCGGELMTDSSTAATFCSYCGSSTVLRCRVSDQKSPDFVIPFAKTKEDCAASYKKAISRSLFAPKEFKEDGQIERFRGIYMPYWIYAFRKQGEVHTTGEVTYRRGDYIYTDHYKIHFNVDMDCAGLSHDAASGFSDALSEAIAPYDMGAAQVFNPAYLSGFYADLGDVDSKVYVDNGQEQMAGVAASRASGMMRTKSTVNINHMVSQLTPEVSRINMGFFPVWFLANRSKDGKRVSYAVVNGQTGRVAADIPISFGKYLLGTLLLAVPIFGILCFFMNLIPFFSLTPIKMMVVTIAIAIVSWVFNIRMQNQLYTKEMSLDDEGYTSTHDLDAETKKALKNATRKKTTVKTKKKFNPAPLFFVGEVLLVIIFNLMNVHSNQASSGLKALLVLSFVGFFIYAIVYNIVRMNRKGVVNKAQTQTVTKVVYKAPMSKKMNSCWKAIASIAICFLTMVIHPFYDTPYYVVAMICMALLAWSFFDIVRYHNRLMTRPIPQFEKRGGEEYES